MGTRRLGWFSSPHRLEHGRRDEVHLKHWIGIGKGICADGMGVMIESQPTFSPFLALNALHLSMVR